MVRIFDAFYRGKTSEFLPRCEPKQLTFPFDKLGAEIR